MFLGKEPGWDSKCGTSIGNWKIIENEAPPGPTHLPADPWGLLT